MADGPFAQAFVYLLAAVVAVPVARRLGLGSVLGYLVAGVVIGPYALGFVGTEGEDVLHFAEFGVVMMLFLIGLELEPARLWRLRVPILGLGGLQVALTALVVAVGAGVAGQDVRAAIAIGLILSLSSTAIVLQTFQEKGLMGTEAGQNGFSVLLFQDIAVIPMLALLPLLATVDAAGGDGGDAPLRELPGWGQALAVLAAVALIVLAGRFLLRPVFRFIAGAGIREVFTAAALLIVVGIALLMDTVGLSPALGTFVAGVVLADSEYRHELEGDIEPFKGLLLGLFFIAVGAGIDFGVLGDDPLRIAGIVAGLVAAKAAVLLALGVRFRMGVDQRTLFALALAQGGEFAFVLLATARQQGVLDATTVSTLVGAVAVSMAVTPLLLLVAEGVLLPRIGPARAERPEADAIDTEHPVIIAGFGGFGSTVGRFLRANGVDATVLDADPGHVEALRRLGLKVFYGDASRLDLLRAAGAERARLLIIALGDGEEAGELVRNVRRHFPDLRVMVRAHDRTGAYRAINDGVDDVYRESLDTALRMGTDALAALGRSRYQAVRAARTFRWHDERHLRELAAVTDRKQHVSEARARIRAIEEAMLGDGEAILAEVDAGWDNTSLRRESAGEG
ncbi:MAG: cation:proton antiporter [Thermoleophilia bacterium]|nr:cation:proton antiporter [Thermoleophilia bacterium]